MTSRTATSRATGRDRPFLVPTGYDVAPQVRADLVHAGGGVLWRQRAGRVEVALVHRPRWDDWSLPKGKAKPGEHPVVTALREVEEETGHRPRIGPFLARYRYTPPSRSRGRGPRKEVTYWSMAALDGAFAAGPEVDDLVWLPLDLARSTATHAIDRKVLDAFSALPARTTALVVVRGATSVSRGLPLDRPLDAAGTLAAGRLVPVLAGTGVGALVSAPSARCLQTLQPYAVRRRLPLGMDGDLGEPAEPVGPLDDAAARLLAVVARGTGVAVCVNGPAVEPLVAAVAGRTGGLVAPDPVLRKGGWWTLHLADGKLVASERHAPIA